MEFKQGSKIDDTCSCGKHYTQIPVNAYEWIFEDLNIVGYGWHCVCGSDMFVKQKIEDAA